MTQDATTTQEVDLYSALEPGDLPDDPAVLKQLLLQLLSLLRKETKRREEVERNMDALLKKLRSFKSPAPCAGQKLLFDPHALAGEDQAAEQGPPPPPPAENSQRRKCRPHGRRRPPANLEQVDMVHDLSDEVKKLFGADELLPLPDVITFQYDYHPAKLLSIRHIQKKYLRRENDVQQPVAGEAPHADTVEPPSTLAEPATAEGEQPAAFVNVAADPNTPAVCPPTEDVKPAAASVPPTAERQGAIDRRRRILLAPKPIVLPSCQAAPGLLAYVWLSKFGDHLPYYRQEAITERYGILFNRSTTCDWMLDLAGVLQELYELMIREVLLSRVLHTDDTTVQCQDPETGQWSTARFWNYLGDERHPLAVYQFTMTHERTHPATFLRDYRGYLQADAYNGYDGIYCDSGGAIIEVGCWQHARKRFKAAVASDGRANIALAYIKSLYAIEQQLRQHRRDSWAQLTIDERAERVAEVRMRQTKPLLDTFGTWLRKICGNVLPKSDFGDAIRYTLNQWEALNEFTRCGLLDADNNEAERGHRGIAIGRKNWRMVGSQRGGHSAAIHFSFISSCKMNRVEPFSYLVDVLQRLPHTPQAELGELLPHRWKPRPAT